MKRKPRKTKRERKVAQCRFCNLYVIMDDETHIIRHQNPVCEDFIRLVTQCGLTANEAPWAVVIAPESNSNKLN